MIQPDLLVLAAGAGVSWTPGAGHRREEESTRMSSFELAGLGCSTGRLIGGGAALF